MLYTIILIIITLICILLTFAVLLQSGDGNGLSGIANAGAGAQMMGTRRTADILSKATTGLGTAFLVLCVLANFAIETNTVQRSTLQENLPGAAVQNDFSTPSESAPAIPAQPEAQTQEGSDSEPAEGGSDN